MYKVIYSSHRIALFHDDPRRDPGFPQAVQVEDGYGFDERLDPNHKPPVEVIPLTGLSPDGKLYKRFWTANEALEAGFVPMGNDPLRFKDWADLLASRTAKGTRNQRGRDENKVKDIG